ncbi:MAG TPA: NAD(P)H-hydrate dehydratase [Elusimicrobia bacterium]|nr:NAD(P)H-hydrate dehydratase [Elusimicrobiota bacterium]
MKTEKITPAFIKRLLPPREKNTHKGDYGKLLIVAGSKGMTGAAVIAARAALKAGAGLVTLVCPDSEQPVIAACLPDVMTFPVSSKGGVFSFKAAAEILEWQKEKKYDLLLIGPGLTLKGRIPEFVVKLVQKSGLPAVIDADALNALALKGALALLKKGRPKIITPHEGEAARLLGGAVEKRSGAALRLAELSGSVVVLKGPETLVACDGRLIKNSTGGPALAKGGSGDALAGLISGLFAQAGGKKGFARQTAFESAAAGVYLHGLCGDLAARQLTGRCVLASELADFLPGAIKSVKSVKC